VSLLERSVLSKCHPESGYRRRFNKAAQYALPHKASNYPSRTSWKQICTAPRARKRSETRKAEFPQTDCNKEVIPLLMGLRQEDHLSRRAAREDDAHGV
jgi:hypothetical protein